MNRLIDGVFILIALVLSIYVFILQRRYLYYKKLSHLLEQAYREEEITYCVMPPKLFRHTFDGLNFIFCQRYRRYVERQFAFFRPKRRKGMSKRENE